MAAVQSATQVGEVVQGMPLLVTPQTVGEVNDLAAGIRQNLAPSQANPLVGKLYQDVVSKNGSPVVPANRYIRWTSKAQYIGMPLSTS